MKLISAMKFDEGGSSEFFKLADGHDYFLHRIEREGKSPVYALLGPSATAYTPYISEHQMDRVLALRSQPERAVDAVPDEVSPTGFTCPGCGAVVTETGTHIEKPDDQPKPVPLAVEPEPPPPAQPEPRKRSSRFFS